MNLLYAKLVSKKEGIFDICVYTHYLKCAIEYREIDNLQEVKEKLVDNQALEVTSVEKNLVCEDVKTIDKTVAKSNVKSSTGVSVNRYNQTASQTKKKKEYVQNSKDVVKEKCIIDLFPREVFEIQAYLYLQMNKIEKQRLAIQAWDKFENLIYKSADDKLALSKMISILRNFEAAGLLTDVEENKIVKKIGQKI